MTRSTLVCPVCGQKVEIEANTEDGRNVIVKLNSNCAMAKRLEGFLYGKTVDAFKETRMDALAGQGYSTSMIFKAAERTLSHSTCPVPLAIMRAIEIEAGLTQPKDMLIQFEKT